MLTGAQRSALSERILAVLVGLEQGMTASDVAGHLREVTQRDVVGRLQALKNQGLVTYARSDESPSAAGMWTMSERGRHAVSQVVMVTEGSSTSKTERQKSS